MQLPSKDASPAEKRRFARFVSRRAKRAKFDALAKTIDAHVKSLRVLELAADEAQDPVQDAYADVEADFDDLRALVSDANIKHRAEKVGIDKTPLFKTVWAEGTGAVIKADVDDRTKEARALADRFDEHLPAKHLLRKSHGPKLRKVADTCDASAKVLGKARAKAKGVADKRDLAETALLATLEKTYGALIEKVGKVAAERFFPRRQPAKKKAPAPSA